jgi:hypothetical protein
LLEDGRDIRTVQELLGHPRRVDDADLHARPEPWPVRRAQPAGRDAGRVISPPFRPGYPTRYTAAPRWIAQPGRSGRRTGK